MKEELIVSGFGGQGILLAGKLLTYAAMLDGRSVTYLPSYGVEVRGGTAYCNVVISDEEVASPIISRADTVIAMNTPSIARFEPVAAVGGTLLFNGSLVDRKPQRTDIRAISVPATAAADRLGNVKAANMVMIGAYLKVKGILPRERLYEALDRILPAHRRSLHEINCRAIEEGYKLLNKQ